MVGASVPEAAVDEDGELDPGEGDVDGPSLLPWNRVGDAVPHAALMEGATQEQFRYRVTSPQLAHPFRDGVGRRAGMSRDMLGSRLGLHGHSRKNSTAVRTASSPALVTVAPRDS